jgi:hypothetical protein
MSDDNVIQFPGPKKDSVESCEPDFWPMIGISTYKVEEINLDPDKLMEVLNDLFGKSSVEMELEELFWQLKQEVKYNPESAQFVVESLKRLTKSFEKN